MDVIVCVHRVVSNNVDKDVPVRSEVSGSGISEFFAS